MEHSYLHTRKLGPSMEHSYPHTRKLGPTMEHSYPHTRKLGPRLGPTMTDNNLLIHVGISKLISQFRSNDSHLDLMSLYNVL